jgi:hypothetical protein
MDPDFYNLMLYAYDDVSSWERVLNADSISVYQKITENSPTVMIKTMALIEGIAPSIVFEVISN